MSVMRVLSLLLMAGYLMVMGASSALAQDDSYKQRNKLMRSSSAAVKQMRAALAKKDYATVEAKAKSIADSLEATSFAKLWPRDSTGGKSRAKPEIWQKWNDFMGHAWNSQQKALALVAAAKTKDDAKVTLAAKAFAPRKSTQSCGDSCHKSYRGPRKK